MFALEAFLPVKLEQLVDQLVEIPLHDLVESVQGQVDAVVRDATLREIIGANPLAAIPAANQSPSLRGTGFVRFPLLVFEQPRAKHPHRLRLVLVLALLVLALDDDSGRQVCDADGTLGLVDLLAARAAGRIVSICRSSSRMSISTAEASGRTATVAALV